MLEVRGARADEVDAAVDACAEAFGDTPDDVREIAAFFRKIHKLDPAAAPENSRVAVVDGEIVSVVQIFERHMRIGGTPVRLGGLGSVGTRPAHRGKGYNTAVLRDSVAYMERKGYDLSLLFTGINGFYARVGWQTFEHAYSATLRRTSSAPAGFDGEIRPMRWDDDLDAVMAIHEATNRQATGPPLRSREFWEAHRIWFPFDANRFRVAVANAKIVAYLRDNLVEYGYADGWESAAVALVHRLFDDNAAVSELKVDYLRPFVDTLVENGFEIASKERTPWVMFRIINLESTLRKLLPQTQARWENARMRLDGALRLRGEFGNVAVAFAGGRLDVCASPDASATLLLEPTHAEMIDLLLGQAALDALAERVVTELSRDAARSVLATLFPPRDVRWYDADSF